MHRSYAPSNQWLRACRNIALCVSGGLALLAMTLLPNPGSGAASAAMTASTDYTRLIQWMTAGSSEKPLTPLGDLETAFSAATHEANLEFIRNHPDLIGTIKSQLNSSEAGPGGVVEAWVAVEEAIVGGLVHHLLPGFLEQHLDAFQFEWIEDDLSMKKKMDRYRYLHRGIQIVGHIGTS